MKNKTYYKNRGFTLPEIMIAILIAGVLLTIGMPRLNKVIEGRQLVGQATEVASALSFARAEATSRGSNVVICSSEDRSTCSDDNDWSTGWIIYSDKNGDGIATDPTEAEILKTEGAMNGEVTLVADVTFLSFNQSGEASSSGVFHLCSGNAEASDLASNKSRLVTVNNVGSANISMGNATCN